MKKRVFLGPLVYYVKSESDRACGEIGCSNVSGVEPFLLCSTTFAFESSDKSLLLSQGYIALGPIQPLRITPIQDNTMPGAANLAGHALT